MPFDAQDVLDLWFPDVGVWQDPAHFSEWMDARMQGGMDAVICERFSDLTIAAARGELDHWADTAEGRVALLIALDQFPRSLWRDTPGAYAQDIKANRLVLEGVANGHYAAVDWTKQLFFVIALGHCEGPDHLDRLSLSDDLAEGIIADTPPQLAGLADPFRAQLARVRSVIERFGRHPHRNPHYGRVSSSDEEAYIATGDFPHLKQEA